MKILLVIVLFISFFINVCSSLAENVEAKGRYYFGFDISKNEACERAREKSEKNALSKVLGENLTSEGVMHCNETGDEEACKHYTSIWTIVSGIIRDMQETNRIILYDEEIKSDFCEVVISADVISAIGERDPSFDLKVTLNEKFFRNQENLKITIIPNGSMYINIFNWSPHKREKVDLIFPNEYDHNNLVESKIEIPSPYSTKKYKFRLDFPVIMTKPIEEFIMVVATRDNIDFMEQYDLNNLKERINEIGLEDRREVTTSYILAKSK